MQSFNTNKNTNEQGTSTNIHSYEHNRLVQTQNRSTTESYTSPPLPNYPPPVRPPPPSDYITEQPRTQSYNQQQLFTTNRRPNNLRFPYAVTPRSANSKSFFHQSTNEQTPTTTVMETIWFQDKDPRTFDGAWLKDQILTIFGWPWYILEKMAIIYAMISMILFITNLIIKFCNAFAIHKAIGKQASITKILLTGIFGIFSQTLTQLVAQIQEENTHDDSDDNNSHYGNLNNKTRKK